jgi:hypothetical protein
MAGGDLAGGKTLRAVTGAYLCFEDEAGVTGRPPKGRTWGRRGVTPRVKVSGRSRGRLSVAGLLCFRPGQPARLCYRLRRHTGRKGERRSLGETDYIRLLDGAHHLLKAPLIVVWDRLSTHISKTMKALVAERDWLTVVPLPGYAPNLNPVEGLWAHIKRSLANLAARTLRSRISTGLGTCGSNGVPGRVIFWRYAHEGRASW